LISRSTWKLAATLSGHNKTITSSRINPRLYRDNNSDSDGGLACYSIVAIASIDSTISVWKPGMSHPLTVMMDVFHMGISDLSWGFNGNILLASSHDGKIVMLHYQQGRLG
jgi:WD40 repeat protein